MTMKELKSIDITSFTTISTGVSVLISVLVSLILVVSLAISVPDSFYVMIYIVPTIVFGTMISSIFIYFTEAYLYNLISKRFGYVKFDIENGTIKKISPKETALIIAVITLAILLIVFLAFSFILPLVLSSMITVLMYAAQTAVAALLYQLMILTSNTTYMLIGILSTTIIISVFSLLGAYIYNILGNSNRGIEVKLTEEGNFTVIDSIEAMPFGIAVGAISLILNVVIGLIMIISGAAMFLALTSILIGFASAFIGAVIIAVFYNFLAGKLGKLKVELK